MPAYNVFFCENFDVMPLLNGEWTATILQRYLEYLRSIPSFSEYSGNFPKNPACSKKLKRFLEFF